MGPHGRLGATTTLSRLLLSRRRSWPTDITRCERYAVRSDPCASGRLRPPRTQRRKGLLGRRHGPPREGAFHHIRCVAWWNVLPNPHYSPASFFEGRCGATVPFDVSGELGCPVGSVRLRVGLVDWADVPEAPIYKDHDHRACEHQIWAYGSPCADPDRPVHEESAAPAVQLRAQRALRSGVAPAIRPHLPSRGDIARCRSTQRHDRYRNISSAKA